MAAAQAYLPRVVRAVVCVCYKCCIPMFDFCCIHIYRNDFRPAAFSHLNATNFANSWQKEEAAASVDSQAKVCNS